MKENQNQYYKLFQTTFLLQLLLCFKFVTEFKASYFPMHIAVQIGKYQ